MSCPFPVLAQSTPGSAAPAALGPSPATDDNAVSTSTADADVTAEPSAPTAWANNSALSWWGPDVEWLVFDEPNDICLDPTERLRRNEFLQSLGDYAGRLFNNLHTAATALGLRLPRRVVQLRDKLTEESYDTTKAGPTIVALERCVSYLIQEGFDVDLRMAKLAILVYSKWNLLCHAKVGDPAIAKDQRRLTEVIDSDISRLPELLPEKQFRYFDEWRRIMQMYGKSQNWKPLNETGRAKDSPVQVLQSLNLQLLPTEERGQMFEEGFAKDRVQDLCRTIEGRKPIVIPRERGISDLLAYRPSKRSASGSPKDGGAKGRDVDVQNLQGFHGDLLKLFRMNSQRGRQVLQEACQVVGRELHRQEAAEEASARKRARKERKASRRG
ncbi:hypothetical protein BJX61DRAFT_541170 [Aspergillus egyptiacus]|nr:hypothetical protein BJX61DRAFT_541170 [Aspergillus egyptiacus]